MSGTKDLLDSVVFKKQEPTRYSYGNGFITGSDSNSNNDPYKYLDYSGTADKAKSTLSDYESGLLNDNLQSSTWNNYASLASNASQIGLGLLDYFDKDKRNFNKLKLEDLRTQVDTNKYKLGQYKGFTNSLRQASNSVMG